MDLQLFTQWAGAVGLALGIINMAWNMLSRSTKGMTDRLEKHSTDLKDHDRRIQALEGEAKHAPTGEQVTELRLSIAQLDGHVKRLDGTLTGLATTVRRMDEYLRSEKA
ncbi:DUF2730 family protein [Sphingopyxis sp. GW247-27LB]|uniref:DUF2730 family protein n=1 Tax=Sphingopyxis sp. GW247-27LB TaxID=2012632 RepID=UPI000BA59D34|nr:DUF2730 family protein [Sphingopyxis sp. GW247-27LB]PAL20206.1 hypothetical protein CD928_17515 [Sphingopyxis sp. GW247-27LB]